MVTTQKFSITLTDGKSVYYPGDDVTGQLEIGLGKEMEMKEIRIKLAGKAHVVFGQGDNKYAETERFFSVPAIIHGGGAAASEGVSLSAGVHNFPFRFRLPQPLATSYEDFNGYIRYYLKARIVKAWQIDETKVVVITVLDRLDLNYLANMMDPSSGSRSKNICCWCCTSGPIEGEIRLERRGYVAGEWIVANATLENNSSSLVRQTSLEFVKIVTYYAQGRQKTDEETLAKQMGPPCNQRQPVNLNNVKLRIPPVPPSEARHCRIIDIQYAVVLVGHLRTCQDNLRAYAPITVGTIPLRSLQQHNEPTGNGEFATGPTAISSAAFRTQGTFPVPAASYVAATPDPLVRCTPKYTFYDRDQSAFNSN